MKNLSEIRVLIVDDEPAICSSLSAFLEDYGFRAGSANSAEEALDVMETEKFDVAIVDLRLPGMSGEEFIVQARAKDPAQRHIIYTGSISYHLSDTMLQLGMRPEHVFLKPIRVLALLVKCIQKLVTEGNSHEQ